MVCKACWLYKNGGRGCHQAYSYTYFDKSDIPCILTTEKGQCSLPPSSTHSPPILFEIQRINRSFLRMLSCHNSLLHTHSSQAALILGIHPRVQARRYSRGNTRPHYYYRSPLRTFRGAGSFVDLPGFPIIFQYCIAVLIYPF